MAITLVPEQQYPAEHAEVLRPDRSFASGQGRRQQNHPVVQVPHIRLDPAAHHCQLISFKGSTAQARQVSHPAVGHTPGSSNHRS
jgi:hypothetical protein